MRRCCLQPLASTTAQMPRGKLPPQLRLYPLTSLVCPLQASCLSTRPTTARRATQGRWCVRHWQSPCHWQHRRWRGMGQLRRAAAPLQAAVDVLHVLLLVPALPRCDGCSLLCPVPLQKVTADYALTTGNELTMTFAATSDKATPVNICNHTYWNLSGDLKTKVRKRVGHLANASANDCGHLMHLLALLVSLADPRPRANAGLPLLPASGRDAGEWQVVTHRSGA